MRHTPTVGTVLSMTPASGVVRFRLASDEWAAPLIGWAVVVQWVSDPDERDEYETGLDAVVLEEARYPVPLTAYLADRPDGTTYSIEMDS